MCLYKSCENTVDFRLNNLTNHSIKCYKFLTYRNGDVTSPYFGFYEWKIGMNESNRLSITEDINENYQEINRGIHVYLNNNSLLIQHHKILYPEDILVEVICDIDDLVAIDIYNTFAAFMKVFLPKEEYDKVKNSY
jgi:hypothetical protein